MLTLEEQRRLSYSRVVEDYDKYRPGYPAESFKLLVDKYGLNSASKVLEIGCGTGQFTQLFMDLECPVDALDISKDMIDFANKKHGKSSGIKFQAVAFEDFEAKEESYDFIVSATAFHWVKPGEREHKTASLLKPGGHLIFFYNHYAEDPVRIEIQQLYEKTLSLEPRDVPIIDNKTEIIFEELKNSTRFADGETFIFPNDVTYDSESYVGMQATHSYQNTLENHQKQDLLAGMREIVKRHGRTVKVSYQTKVFCLKKRG